MSVSYGEVLAETERHLYHSRRYRWPTLRSITHHGDEIAASAFSPVRFIRPLQLSVFTPDVARCLENETSALWASFGTLRPDVALVRLIGPGHRKTINRLHNMVFVAVGEATNHEVIDLCGDFDAFVDGLGNDTRRNIRSSFRELDAQHLTFSYAEGPSAQLPSNAEELATDNMPRAIGIPTMRTDEILVREQDCPYLGMITTREGNVVSLIRGYIVDGYATVVYQLNPRSFPKTGRAGPSLLHRALLIKHFSTIGLKGVIFVGGCSGMLQPSCRTVVAQSYLAVSVKPLAWVRILLYLATKPRLWQFLLRKLVRGVN